MRTKWIAAFTEAMRRLGREKQFFVEPCKEHANCVVVQVYKREEHIAWKEHVAASAARQIAKSQ